MRPVTPVEACCRVWGVLNVTPDSFSDGGRFPDAESAIRAGLEMARDGAQVIDVGGASSRPRGQTYGDGAASVPVDEEIARTEPVVRGLAERGLVVSIDTTSGRVAARALAAGARIVNDVSMGKDPELLSAVAAAGAEVVLMHNRGAGEIDAESTDYGPDVVLEVARELARSVVAAREHGIASPRIWVDPGIGFAKTAIQSATLLARLPALSLALSSSLGFAPRLLVGASRKSFLATLAPLADGSLAPPSARLASSLVAVSVAAAGGAHAVRVHDVLETHQALLAERALGALKASHPSPGEAPRG